MIKKEGNKWYVYNESGNKKLSKGYSKKSEAEKRLKEIETFKQKNSSDSLSIQRIDYELNEDTIVIYNVPVVAEMVQEYNDGFAYKPFDVIKEIKVDQVPLTLRDDVPKHPDAHLNHLGTKSKADVVVGFMTEPSKPKSSQEDKKKVYADFIIHRTPKTKELEEAILNNESIDTSIGFNFEQLDIKGEFQGQKFDYIQNNIVLDHNAILIDSTGRKAKGRMPNPIGGIGADAIKEGKKMTDEKLKARVDELESEKEELEKKAKEAEEAKEEAEKKVEETEAAKEEAEKAKEEAEKKAGAEEELKKENADLKKELDEYRKERKERIDKIKEEFTKENPALKEMIDSAEEKVLLKMAADLKTKTRQAKDIGARMEGNDKNKKKVDDTAINNYFGLNKESGKTEA